MNQHQHVGIAYTPTAVDKLGPPAAYFTEERYLGYREVDYAKPYSRFFHATPRPLQAHVANVLRSGPTASSNVVPITDAARRMSHSGLLPLETGYGMGADGTACVACLTNMPNVEPVMWQWWFGWHLVESARYKLWHPGAHVFTAPGRSDSSGEGGGASRYIGNVSYIDEYIGTRLMQLAVRFVAPSTLGFPEDSADCVTIVGRGGPSRAPVTAVWLIHQVRRVPGGSQMRSRFYIGAPQPLIGVRPVDAGTTGVQSEPAPTDLLKHCGTEMNHLASFLPDLYLAFSRAD